MTLRARTTRARGFALTTGRTIGLIGWLSTLLTRTNKHTNQKSSANYVHNTLKCWLKPVALLNLKSCKGEEGRGDLKLLVIFLRFKVLTRNKLNKSTGLCAWLGKKGKDRFHSLRIFHLR